MADYHSILSSLVDGLPEPGLEPRQEVYERARRALAVQLTTVEPPLTSVEIDREKRALDDAIDRIERARIKPAAVPMPSVDIAPRGRAAEPEPGPRPSPRGAGALDTRPAAIRRGGRRARPSLLLLPIVLIAIPIGVVAYLWRDNPAPASPPPEPPPVVAPAPAPSADPKYDDRVGGASRPAPTPAEATPPAAAPARPPIAAAEQRPPVPPPNLGPDLAVAQRALLFEENAADPQNPSVTAGRAIWRLDALNGGQGQPLEMVIRGAVEIPGSGLLLAILMRRNTDTTLPASHTIELTFSSTPTVSAPVRVVRDVALPMMRPEETIRGIALAGLPVPVKENVFLVGLSDLKGDVERNAELLLKRNWIEIPIRFAAGQKAVLLFDKGLSGERVFNEAFRQWGQAPP